MNKPLVSVWLIAYNHEAYIAEAIEGVLKQQTNFAVEIIIGEDCSTDGTRAIVQAYQQRYPEQITLFLPETNLGMVGILRPTYGLCRGKYVAMLDGDDYWTDPLKLQKQVDQLESHPTVRFSFHKASILHQATGTITESGEPTWGAVPGELQLADFLSNGNEVVTLSVLFRNDLGTLPEWYYQLPYPDLALYFLLLLPGGTCRYLPANMGVYRVHRAGWFSSLPAQHRYQHGARFLELIGEHLAPQHERLLRRELQRSYYELFLVALKKRQLGKALHHWSRLGINHTKAAPQGPRRWPHVWLLIGLRHTGYVLHRLGIGKVSV